MKLLYPRTFAVALIGAALCAFTPDCVTVQTIALVVGVAGLLALATDVSKRETRK